MTGEMSKPLMKWRKMPGGQSYLVSAYVGNRGILCVAVHVDPSRDRASSEVLAISAMLNTHGVMPRFPGEPIEREAA